MQTETRDSLQRRLKTLHKNLAALEEQKAKMGLDVTVRVLNEIEDTQQQIAEIEDRLAHGDFGADGRFLGMRPPRIYHNLPQPNYGTFIGREKELAQVRGILRPYPHSQHALVTIDGIGGIGKSALAMEAAHRYLRECDTLPEEEQFEAIIWTSAKSSVLTADGIEPRQQIVRTLDDIYTTISVALEREDITRARSEEQDELVRHALTRQRTLLVVDNLETVDDERVNAFLRELPAPTKAIVTTRHRIDVAYPVRLTGMPREDGLALIVQECDKKGVTLTEAKAEKLYDRTGGVPLAVVWSIAQMGYGYEIETVLHRLGRPIEDISRFCFEGTMERIRGSGAHGLLMALSLFATDASREALGYVADLPELDRDEGLVILEKFSLVNRRHDRFLMLPLTNTFVISEVHKDESWETSARERWLQYYLNLSQRYGRADSRWLQRPQIEPEFRNLVDALEWCWGHQRNEEFIQICIAFERFVWSQGYWNLWNRLTDQGIELSRLIGDHQAEAKLLRSRGLMFTQRDEPKKAMHHLQQAKDVALMHDLSKELVKALREMGLALCNQSSLSQAREVVESALSIAQQMDDEELESQVQIRLADIDYREGKYQSAELRLKQTKYYHAEGGDDLSIWMCSVFRFLGKIAIAKEDYEAAGRAFERSLQVAEQLHIVPDMGYGYKWLARLKARLGEVEEARRLASKARDIFESLQSPGQLAKAEEILHGLE